ncbi:MAG: isopenicillin N synthase family oxygenase [Hydrogenophilaceae bacterium]|jgi:isopenicillin N synthase-like dioxygenase|nr:isopenicillin N synthase family oxygenase [Hydrogenophilaceae bacterium]
MSASPAALADHVPLVSLAEEARDQAGFAQALGASFARFGFAIVADHGIEAALIEAALAKTKAFFALPEAQKRAYHVPGGMGQRGYVPFGIEAAKGAMSVDLKEFWHVGRELPDGHRYRAQMPANLWPAEIQGFREDVYALYTALDACGLKILAAIARYLGLAKDFFDDTVRDGNSVLRLLHYPPVPENAGGVRAGAHEDINTITLLLGAEEAGLELLDRDGRWLAVDPPEGALVVNIGDMLQRLTNHALPSTTHRVVNPTRERAHLPRYSIPFFLHFRPDYLIETLPGCVSAERPNRYPEPITAQDYLMQRLKEIRLA